MEIPQRRKSRIENLRGAAKVFGFGFSMPLVIMAELRSSAIFEAVTIIGPYIYFNLAGMLLMFLSFIAFFIALLSSLSSGKYLIEIAIGSDIEVGICHNCRE